MPVAGQRREIVDQPLDIVARVRSVGVTGHLRLLPRRESRIGDSGVFLQGSEILDKIKLVGITGQGIFMIDQELAKRTLNPAIFTGGGEE